MIKYLSLSGTWLCEIKSKTMQTKQTIAIIGATGNIGSAVSKSLARDNYKLLLCAKDFDKLQVLINDIKEGSPAADLEGIDCPMVAGWEADIIILAVPRQDE